MGLCQSSRFIKYATNVGIILAELYDGKQRFAKLFATGTRRPRPKSAFSRAIPWRQKNWLASPLVWVACFRLAGEASSLRRRARWRRQLAMKLTSTSRNRKESPREYTFVFDLLVKINLCRNIMRFYDKK